MPTKNNGESIEEILYAQRLADINPVVRNKTLKNLTKYIQTKSLGRQGFTYDDLITIWKGLYYCMYMSDKPLIQEDLAEDVSNLIHKFSGSAQKLLFFKAGVDTFVREWDGIDKFRMDKFAMLFTRVLRQCLVYLRRSGWNVDDVNNVVDVLHFSIVCPSDDINSKPLGLKMHLVDVILEELAKIGRENLPHAVIMTFLYPFFKVIAISGQGRYLHAVRENIIRALIKQSGIGDEDELGGSDTDENDGEDEEDESEDAAADEDVNDDASDEDEIKDGNEDESEDAVDEDEIEDANEESESAESKAQKDEETDDEEKLPLDPRAGGVDVYLPRLTPDYRKIAIALQTMGSVNGVTQKKRNIIYKHVQEFIDLAEGVYPLKELNFPVHGRQKKWMKKAVKQHIERAYDPNNGIVKDKIKTNSNFSNKLNKYDFLESKGNKSKGRPWQKSWNPLKKKTAEENSGSKKEKVDVNAEIENKMTEVCDKIGLPINFNKNNENSILNQRFDNKSFDVTAKLTSKNTKKRKFIGSDNEWEVKKITKKTKEAPEITPTLKGVETYKPVTEIASSVIVTTEKVNEKKNSKLETVSVLLQSEEKINVCVTNGELKKKKKVMKLMLNKLPEEPQKKKKKKRPTKTKTVTKNEDSSLKDMWDEPLQKGEIEIFIKSRKQINKEKKMPKKSLVIKKPAKVNTKGKTLKINLNKNREHEFNDYRRILKSSPGIPFSANKKPRLSALKNSTSSPNKVGKPCLSRKYFVKGKLMKKNVFGKEFTDYELS